MSEWAGQVDPSATVRYYLNIAEVEPSLPYPSNGVITLHASSASKELPRNEKIHASYPYFLQVTGLRGGDGMVALGVALHTILLWCDTLIELGPRICWDANGVSVFDFDLATDFKGHWGHHGDTLPTTALDAMALHGPAIWRLNRGDEFNPFANAFRLYTAGLRMRQVDAALVSFVSALEGLFTTSGDNISYRFSLAIACLLETSKEQRRDLVQEAKRVYSARSKTVHGAPIDKSSERAAVSLVDFLAPQAEELCRRAFRRILELGLADFVKSDRGGRRDEFFTLLALGYSISEAVSEMRISLTS